MNGFEAEEKRTLRGWKHGDDPDLLISEEKYRQFTDPNITPEDPKLRLVLDSFKGAFDE